MLDEFDGFFLLFPQLDVSVEGRGDEKIGPVAQAR